MGRISTITEEVLRINRQARNSDKELHIAVLERLGANLDEQQKEILRSYSFESVRRTRQKFQENGQYLPDQFVGRERRLKSYEMQQVTPSIKPEKIDERIEQAKAISWLDEE